MKELIEYLKQKKIKYQEIDEFHIQINDEIYFLVLPDEEDLLFSSELQLLTNYQNCDKYVYSFGGKWYWENKSDAEHPKLNELLYIGKIQDDIDTKSFLGIHGGYEILNGSRLYGDWCKKAKFLGCETLGILEKNTLAGVLKFQLECKKNGIKPIIGATYTVLRESEDYRYDLKFLVKDEIGWENLLLINKEVNVINNKYITEDRLPELIKGLFVIVDPKSFDFDKLNKFIKQNIDFYQLDTVEFTNNDTDKKYLENLKKFFKSPINPISIVDAYYLEQEHFETKQILNKISGVREYDSENQFFKSKSEYFDELEKLFNIKDESLFNIFELAIKNERWVVDGCDFMIKTGERHLPVYTMTEEQSAQFENNEDLFWNLITDGFKSRSIPKDLVHNYMERVEKEFTVIEKGKVIDYFLILWDVINWCKTQNILTGIGRGSAPGTIIAYLLGITHLDPIQFDLLFERFLNEGRVLTALPDIDVDFTGNRRDEVKHYLEHKYGETQVCSVGTYTTLKLKALLKEFGRISGEDHMEMNYITKILDLEEGGMVDIFKNAVKNKRIRRFVQDNSHLINYTNYLLKQPKSPSIHACATLILPKEKEVFSWTPVKVMSLTDGQSMYVTEWEGNELEEAGFLKEDILGILQLTKFQEILALIKQETNEDIDIYNVSLDDEEVYRYFKNGWNGDVFHFGSTGLTGYCKLLQPENIEDLIAGISLFRPGSMESGFHNEYILLKEGKREPVYDYGLKEVTESTYGLYIYQEQIMKSCQVLANFTLVEADDIRKALGKMKPELIKSYGQQFIDKAVENNCPKEEAEEIWKKLARFASYGFNKCISGEERFYRLGLNKDSFRPTISEMYKIKNSKSYAEMSGHISLHDRYSQFGYGVSFSLNQEGRLVKNRIKDIRYEGQRDVFELTLINGLSIRTTDNHKFPTSNGEKLLRDIDISQDLLFYKLGYQSEDTSYGFTDKGKINNSRYHSQDLVYKFTLNSEPGKEGFQKINTSFTQLEYYNNNLKKSYCEICNKTNCRLEIHHKDNRHGNNEVENLITVCSSCHKKEHYKLGRVKQGQKGLLTELVQIKSIQCVGLEDVYDVEMENPYHTFTTDKGIVTCNSHASAYSVTGYISQWLKVHYPVYFWSTALKYASDKDSMKYISEINLTGNIKIMPVEINNSKDEIYTDFKNKTIFWPLLSVKQCGEKAAEQIFSLRNKDGQFFTFEEFLERNKFKSSKVTKQVIENLVISGAFDQIENIEYPSQRIRLIETYRKLNKIKVDKEKDLFESNKSQLRFDWWWLLQQKNISSISLFDYQSLLEEHNSSGDLYITPEDFQLEHYSKERTKVKIGGVIVEVTVRESKKGTWAKVLIESNYSFITIVIWAEQYRSLFRDLDLAQEIKSILLINGKIVLDSYHNENVLQTYEDTEFIILK